MKKDCVIGIHSIISVLKNPSRKETELYATQKGLENLKKELGRNKELLENAKCEILTLEKFYNFARDEAKKLGFDLQKPPSQIFLKTSAKEVYSPSWIYDNLGTRKMKIFCLDQVTDVQNGAAIVRTAAFFNVDALVLGQKGNMGLSPGFYRISSGGLEHIKLVKCSNLSKFLRKIQEMEVECLGFGENFGQEATIDKLQKDSSRCLVMGAEDKGLSHAVSEVLPNKVALFPQGKIKSLNVSVAAGIGMERFFK